MIVNDMRIHHPLLLMSCKRRTVTAIVGIIVARLNIRLKGPVPLSAFVSKTIESSIESIIDIISVNSAQYQNSLLNERPLKTVYFLKTAVTASVKFI
jgi:hypothetical protein